MSVTDTSVKTYIDGLDEKSDNAAVEDAPPGLARQVRKRRRALKISQAELADKAGTSRDTVWRLERGESIGTTTLERIAKVLHVSFDELFSSKPVRSPTPPPDRVESIMASMRRAWMEGGEDVRVIFRALATRFPPLDEPPAAVEASEPTPGRPVARSARGGGRRG